MAGDATELAVGYLSLLPSMKGFTGRVEKELGNTGQSIGRGFGKDFGRAVVQAAGPDIGKLKAQLSAAESSHSDALGKMRVAQAKLTEARKKGNAESSRTIAAEENLKKAQRELDGAQDNLKKSTEGLAKGQKDLATDSGKAEKASKSLGNAQPGVQKKLKHTEKVSKETGKGMRVAFSGLGKLFAPLAGIALGAGIVNFAKGAIAEQREAQKVGAVTNQILKTTGSAAKVSADHVSELANAISLKTGIDDEAIQSGENLLLTFKNVRNEAGKGGKIFDRATQGAVDLSKAGFGSLTSTSKLLGKALNDPLKGMTGLSRMGVTFTKGEQSQIKVLLSKGKTLDAQQLILGKVEGKVKGVAAASATMGEKSKVAFDNIKESVGKSLVGPLDFLGKIFVTKIAPAIQGFITGMQKGSGAGGAFVNGFKTVVGFIQTKVLPVFRSIGGFITQNVVPAAKTFGEVFVTKVLPVLKQLGGFVLTVLVPALGALAKFVVTQVLPVIWKIAGTIWSALGDAIAFIKKNVVPVFLSIGETMRHTWSVLSPILAAIVGYFKKNWPAIYAVIKQVFTQVWSIVKDILVLVQNRIKLVTSVIQYIWDRWGKQISTIVGSAFKTVLGVISGVMKIVGGIVKVITGVMTGNWKQAGEGIKGIVNGLKQVLISIWTNIGVQVKTILGSLITKLVGKFRDLLNWTSSTFKTGMAKVKDFLLAPFKLAKEGIDKVIGGIKTFLTTQVAGWKKIIEGIKGSFAIPINFVIDKVINGGVLKAYNKIADVVKLSHVDDVSRIAGYHGGGVVKGPRGKRDNILGVNSKGTPIARIESDEFVMPRKKKKWFPLLESIRLGHLNKVPEGMLPGFRNGGMVPDAGAGPGPSARVSYKGHTFSALFAQAIKLAEHLAGYGFNIFQGGFRPATSYSGTSHNKDAIDFGPVTATSVLAARAAGIAAWDRTGMGNWVAHIHGVPLPGHGYPGGSAVWQAQDYLNGGNGLGGKDNGAGSAGANTNKGGKGFFGSIKDFVLGAPLKAFHAIVDPILGKVKEISGSPFGQIVGKIPGVLVNGILDKVKNTPEDILSSALSFGGYARGTNNARAGWHWTGENGRELVNFGRGGGSVVPNRESELIAAGAGSGFELNQNFYGSVGGDPEDIAKASLVKFKDAMNARGARYR